MCGVDDPLADVDWLLGRVVEFDELASAPVVARGILLELIDRYVVSDQQHCRRRGIHIVA